MSVLGLVALALSVRVIGLDWGLPSAQQLGSFHPDEVDIAGRAALMASTSDLNPHFFNYGTATIYATAALGAMLRLSTNAEWHLLCRLLTALLGTATVALTFSLARSLLTAEPRNATALLAAGLLALAPGHVVHSHFATVDVPAAFFVVASATCAAQMFHSNSLRWPALASVCAGLAAATKYNMGLAILFVPTASWLAHRDRALLPAAAPASWSILAPFVVLPAALAFLVSCPFALIDFSTFWRDFTFELHHVRTGSGLIFQGVGPGWWNHLNTNLPFALTTPLLVCSLAGWLIGWRQRQRWVLFVAAFVVPYAFVIGAAQVSFLRYVIPLLPFLCMAAASGLIELRAHSRLASAAMVAFSAVFALPAVQPFVTTDPRVAAAAWLREHVNPNDRIGLLTQPWFYTPPLTPYNLGPRNPRNSPGNERFVICPGWDAKKLERELPEWFVTSEFETRDEVRLGDPRARDFMEVLKFHYRASYHYPPRSTRGFAAGFPNRDLWTPHDWLYTRPTIRIYRRKVKES